MDAVLLGMLHLPVFVWFHVLLPITYTIAFVAHGLE